MESCKLVGIVEARLKSTVEGGGGCPLGSTTVSSVYAGKGIDMFKIAGDGV